MWGYLLTITCFLLQIGALHAQADSSSVVIERFPDGAIHRKYHVIVTEVVDTVFTEAQDGSLSNMAISIYMKRCPSGAFIEFDRHGFVVAMGDLLYTYGSSCRIGDMEHSMKGVCWSGLSNTLFPGLPTLKRILVASMSNDLH